MEKNDNRRTNDIAKQINQLFNNLKKREDLVVVPTDKTNSNILISTSFYSNRTTKHLVEEDIKTTKGTLMEGWRSPSGSGGEGINYIGGYESAFFADLAAAYILEKAEDIFDDSLFNEIYCDDGIDIKNSILTIDDKQICFVFRVSH